MAHEHLISISYDYYFNQCCLNYYQILVNTFINRSPFSGAVFLKIKHVFAEPRDHFKMQIVSRCVWGGGPDSLNKVQGPAWCCLLEGHTLRSL